jgi:hypothetical protein
MIRNLILLFIVLNIISCRSIFFKEYRNNYYKIHYIDLEFIDIGQPKDTVVKNNSNLFTNCKVVKQYYNHTPNITSTVLRFNLSTQGFERGLFGSGEPIAGLIGKIATVNFYLLTDSGKININHLIKDTGIHDSPLLLIDSTGKFDGFSTHTLTSYKMRNCDCTEPVRISGVKDFIDQFNIYTDFNTGLKSRNLNFSYLFFLESKINKMIDNKKRVFMVELLIKYPHKKRLVKIIGRSQ